MTELSFLLDLLLDHKLPKATREAITDRIRGFDVRHPINPITYQTPSQRPPKTAQSPSTQRILDEMANEGLVLSPEPQAIHEAPGMPAQIAQTPAAAIALAQRNEAIRIATSGKEEKGRTSPRKF